MKPFPRFAVLLLFLAAACTPAPTGTALPPTVAPSPTPAAPVQLDAGLDELPSYRAWLVLQFTGEDISGSPTTARFVSVEEINRAENTTHRMARSDLKNERPGSVDIYRSPSQTYLVSSERVEQAGCQQIDAAQLNRQAEFAPRPADLFPALVRGELLTSDDKIGTIPALRYQLSGAELSLGKAENVTGTLWFARDGKTILRFTGSAEGALSLGGGATYGRVEWEYLLTDIGAVHLTLPPDCQALAEIDFPVPPNASGLARLGAVLSFETAAAPKEIIDFYRSELAGQGYDIQIDSGGGSAYSLSGKREGKNLQVTVTTANGLSQVEINLPTP